MNVNSDSVAFPWLEDLAASTKPARNAGASARLKLPIEDPKKMTHLGLCKLSESFSQDRASS